MPTITGTPRSRNDRAGATARMFWSSVLPKPKPRIYYQLLMRNPSFHARHASVAIKNLLPDSLHHRYCGLSCMLRGSPCMCMRHAATPPAATASSAPGARNALTSLIMVAPALIAARITSGLEVSTETGCFISTSASTTGITRRSSSCTSNRHTARTGRFPPTSSQIGPLFDQPRRMLKRLLERIEQTAVRKGIGRDIDDPHHEGTVMGGG